MRVSILPSSVMQEVSHGGSFLSTYIIDETVAIDAGSLGLLGSLDQQYAITDIFLTHCHLDHIATLPIFLDTVYQSPGDTVTLHGSQHTLNVLRANLFNGEIWPDFFAMAEQGMPFLKINVLAPDQVYQVGRLQITPIEVDHVVPTLAYLVESPETAIAIVTDTGPTQEVWRHASRLNHLSTLFLEVSFPNALDELAFVAKHLTPELFENELAKLNRPVRCIAIHMKARFADQIADQLRTIKIPGISVELARSGMIYEC